MKKWVLFFFLTITIPSYSQIFDKDTTSRKAPFDTNVIKSSPYLSETSDTTNFDFWIWNDRRNLTEILNERSGYFINYVFEGGKNPINYNGFSNNLVGIFRDGIQLNDAYFQGFDNEYISINEIEKIEEIPTSLSFLYGINSSGRSINIITKNYFRRETFSQLRYCQDRHGSLNADIYFDIPITRKLAFLIQINNHVSDGNYKNTDFRIWRGKTRLNYYPSSAFNLKMEFYYNKIQRGLNEGLIYSTEDTLISPIIAKAVNTDAYEIIQNYFADISATLRIFRESRSLTKLKLYTINTTRNYRDEENRQNPNGIYRKLDFHTVVYAMDLNQNFYKRITKEFSFNLLAGGTGYLNFYNNSIEQGFKKTYTSLYSRIDLQYRNSYIAGGIRYNNFDNTNLINSGIYSKITIYEKDNFRFGITGGLSRTENKLNPSTADKLETRQTEGGIFISKGIISLSGSYYLNKISSEQNHGFNTNINLTSKHFNGYLIFDYSNSNIFPRYSIKSDISYRDYFFNNKLDIRAGFNVKYLNDLNPPRFDEIFYQITPLEITNFGKNNFSAEFYIGARIGKANVTFSLGNLFDFLNYNTYIYPENNRGGFLNVISKFTIYWDFIN